MRAVRLAAGGLLLAACAAAGGEAVFSVSGPAVVVLAAVPPEPLLEADEGLATLLDDFMYYWADARPRLDSLGLASPYEPLDWRARRFRVRVGGRCWSGALPPEPYGTVGYLLADPAREPRLLSGLLVDEDLADSAAAYLAGAPVGMPLRERPACP